MPALTNSLEAMTTPLTATHTEAVDGATRIRTWNGIAVPWIVRTEEYTQALLENRAGPAEDPHNHLTAMFKSVEAQTIRDNPQIRKIIYLGAAALTQQYSDDPGLHKRQVNYLIDIACSTENNTSVHVLANSGTMQASADRGAVTLYKHPSRSFAEEETWTSGVLVTENPGAIREISLAFRALQQNALSSRESLEYMERITTTL